MIRRYSRPRHFTAGCARSRRPRWMKLQGLHHHTLATRLRHLFPPACRGMPGFRHPTGSPDGREWPSTKEHRPPICGQCFHVPQVILVDVHMRLQTPAYGMAPAADRRANSPASSSAGTPARSDAQDPAARHIRATAGILRDSCAAANSSATTRLRQCSSGRSPCRRVLFASTVPAPLPTKASARSPDKPSRTLAPPIVRTMLSAACTRQELVFYLRIGKETAGPVRV